MPEPMTSKERVRAEYPDSWEGFSGKIYRSRISPDLPLTDEEYAKLVIGENWDDAASKLPTMSTGEGAVPETKLPTPPVERCMCGRNYLDENCPIHAKLPTPAPQTAGYLSEVKKPVEPLNENQLWGRAAPQTEQEPLIRVTPNEFALLMDTELKANEPQKGDWTKWKPNPVGALRELGHHVGKLTDNIRDEGKVREYAADVANICMKIYERARERWSDALYMMPTPPPPTPKAESVELPPMDVTNEDVLTALGEMKSCHEGDGDSEEGVWRVRIMNQRQRRLCRERQLLEALSSLNTERERVRELERERDDIWDCAMSQSVGLRYDYEGKFFINERAEAAEAELTMKDEALRKIAEDFIGTWGWFHPDDPKITNARAALHDTKEEESQ